LQNKHKANEIVLNLTISKRFDGLAEHRKQIKAAAIVARPQRGSHKSGSLAVKKATRSVQLGSESRKISLLRKTNS